ncbi:hypothetical protein V5O48_007403 [Marasmius crinis-equi]|uniref:Uncharacterized protein n=1 Tax=Marasmius crinis-equi TaxID=585013 RepID=A0ABR3FHD6_9AGAR
MLLGTGYRKLVSHGQSPHIRLPGLTIRRAFITLIALVFSTIVLLFVTQTKVYIYPKSFLFWKGGKLRGTPPDWKELRAFEDSLPQHNLELPFPEGKDGRYVRFSNEIRQLGWNNVLNEVLINTVLAHDTNRAYVFQDYHWKPSYHPWLIPPVTLSETRRRPRTPLTALISGPSVGGPWEQGDSAPRAVSERYWEVVCPEERRKVYWTGDEKPKVPKPSEESLRSSPYGYAGGPVGNNQQENWDSPWGDAIYDHWKDLLLNSNESCVEIRPGFEDGAYDSDPYQQTFDVRMWATHKALPLWEMFRDSPVSKLLGPSGIVKSGVDRNLDLFQDRSKARERIQEGDPLSTTLAVHVRLGDFSDACVNLLAAYNLTFYAWNLLPSLSEEDVFIPPPGGVPSSSGELVYGKNSPENTAFYLERCQPSIEQLVHKVQAVRSSLQMPLHTLYILTNSALSELSPLLEAFRSQGGWESIVTSKDLVLDDYQRDVEGAVDMEIAIRAGGFIGNGWSSMTSNIVHQRLVGGHDPKTIRFW